MYFTVCLCFWFANITTALINFVAVTVRQYVPAFGVKDDSIVKAADGSIHTCYGITKPQLDKFPFVLIFPETPSPSASKVNIVLEGSDLYCDVFDETCSELATQFYTRSFKDSKDNPQCLPLCGYEVPCHIVSAASTRDRCEFQCTCPSGGCNEVVFLANNGALKQGQTMKVCEITVKLWVS